MFEGKGGEGRVGRLFCGEEMSDKVRSMCPI